MNSRPGLSYGTRRKKETVLKQVVTGSRVTLDATEDLVIIERNRIE
jgi:hypothetical protein